MTGRVIRRRNRPNLYPDERMLDAARDVFYERGFAETSMVDIGERAGVTKPTLYARFGGKEALYDRVLELAATSLMDDLRAVYERLEWDEPELATRRPFDAFLGWARSNAVEFKLLFGLDTGTPLNVVHRTKALESLADLVLDTVQRMMADANLRAGRRTALLATVVVGLLDYTTRWAVEHDPDGEIDVSGFITEFFLAGLERVSPQMAPPSRRRERAAKSK